MAFTCLFISPIQSQSPLLSDTTHLEWSLPVYLYLLYRTSHHYIPVYLYLLCKASPITFRHGPFRMVFTCLFISPIQNLSPLHTCLFISPIQNQSPLHTCLFISPIQSQSPLLSDTAHLEWSLDVLNCMPWSGNFIVSMLYTYTIKNITSQTCPCSHLGQGTSLYLCCIPTQ